MIYTEGARKIRKKRKELAKDHHTRTILNLISFASMILAVIFIVLLVLSRQEQVQVWYRTYLGYLIEAQHTVENMDNKINVFIVIVFLYTFKSLLSIYPLSALCAVTSTVFPFYFSIPINISGLLILYSVRYYWGKRVGAGGLQRILKRNKTVKYLVENDGNGNPWLLSFFRFLPAIPVNVVSQLYGAMGFNFKHYVCVSLAGFAPLLISYTFIGSNLFNPLSAAFLVPFIIIFTLTSITTITASKILKVQNRRKKSNG